MRIFAPPYYNSFRCINKRCKHSCCIGWEIGIDTDTIAKYNLHSEGYFPSIKASIEENKADGVSIFKLCEGKRCPHLCNDGLCRVIIECGEDYIPEICREHPRFYNLTERGLEVGIGLSCEAAASITLLSDEHIPIFTKEEKLDLCLPTFSLEGRDRLLRLALSDKGIESKIEEIAKEFSIPQSFLLSESILKILSRLEYLDPESPNILTRVAPTRCATMLEERIFARALSYFLYRHASAAEDSYDMRSSVGAALFLTVLLKALTLSLPEGIDSTLDIARIISTELEYSEDNLEEIKLSIDFT